MELSQWALCWLLKQTYIKTVIPGIKNLEQLEYNAKASEFNIIT